jgi:hypothetical protein
MREVPTSERATDRQAKEKFFLTQKQLNPAPSGGKANYSLIVITKAGPSGARFLLLAKLSVFFFAKVFNLAGYVFINRISWNAERTS